MLIQRDASLDAGSGKGSTIMLASPSFMPHTKKFSAISRSHVFVAHIYFVELHVRVSDYGAHEIKD